MAYAGYLLKIGSVQLPDRYVCNYKITPDRRTDKDSYTDGNGKLVRGILPHKRNGFTFNTGIITDKDIPYLASIFDGRDNISVTYWHPTSQSYKTGNFYVPDMELEVLMTIGLLVYYRPIQLEMIEY